MSKVIIEGPTFVLDNFNEFKEVLEMRLPLVQRFLSERDSRGNNHLEPITHVEIAVTFPELNDPAFNYTAFAKQYLDEVYSCNRFAELPDGQMAVYILIQV